MKLIRKGCFETNSSSSHCIVLSLEGVKERKNLRYWVHDLTKSTPKTEEIDLLVRNLRDFRDAPDKGAFRSENPGIYLFENYLYPGYANLGQYDFGWGPDKVTTPDRKLTYAFLWLSGGNYDHIYLKSLEVIDSFIENPEKGDLDPIIQALLILQRYTKQNVYLRHGAGYVDHQSCQHSERVMEEVLACATTKGSFIYLDHDNH